MIVEALTKELSKHDPKTLAPNSNVCRILLHKKDGNPKGIIAIYQDGQLYATLRGVRYRSHITDPNSIPGLLEFLDKHPQNR